MVWEEMGMGLRGEESVGVDSGTWMRERGIYSLGVGRSQANELAYNTDTRMYIQWKNQHLNDLETSFPGSPATVGDPGFHTVVSRRIQWPEELEFGHEEVGEQVKASCPRGSYFFGPRACQSCHGARAGIYIFFGLPNFPQFCCPV
jgi:hypothetical protein